MMNANAKINEISKVKFQIKLETIFAYLYLVAATAGIIAVFVLSSEFDNGTIRYGLILPAYFIWQGIRGLKKSKELKDDLKRIT